MKATDSMMSFANIRCPCGGAENSKENNHTNPKNKGVGNGNFISYQNCCARFIEDGVIAPDASLLMRSRYTAYVLEKKSYLLQTWRADHRPQDIEFDEDIKWLGLEVKQHTLTGDATADVEFVARYRISGKGHRMHERSHFVLQDETWFYIHGETPE